MNKFKVLGVVPARGGSKGVHKKNIKPLAGKPLMVYTIEAALRSIKLDRVVVSTDDEEVAAMSLKYGAEVPFIRPAKIARDDTPDFPVIKHALEWLERHEDWKADIIVYLRPTTPGKTADDIDKVVMRLINNRRLDSVRSVSLCDDHPYWMKIIKKDRLYPLLSDKSEAQYPRRQLLPPVYVLNGVVDAMRAENIRNNFLYGRNMGAIIIEPERAIDIDTMLDFKIAELVLRENYGNA